MATWADIQRLASDLQRVQLSQSAKKLSEANCIEVVGKLMSSGKIDVVFTRDGHSYVTNKHLFTEVANGCLAAGGRVSLTDISTSLNLDFDHVDRTARELVKTDTEYVLSKGELFAGDYVNSLQSDLRILLAENGTRTTAFLCKYWNLSQELLQSLLLDKLTSSSDMEVMVDGDTIFTSEYLSQHKNILRAVLAAVTKPTPISSIQTRVGLPVKRFWAAFDELLQEGEVAGRLNGSRTSASCAYVPAMYDMLVEMCVQNMYRQNEYLQLSMLKKLGLSDTKASIQKLIDDKTIELLPSLAVSPSVLEQCYAAVQEVVTRDGSCDVQTALQPLGIPLDVADYDVICEKFAKKNKTCDTAEGFVYSVDLLSKAVNSLEDQIQARAHEELNRIEKEKKQQVKAAQPAAPAKVVDEDENWADSGKKSNKKKGGRGAGGGGKSKAAAKSADDDEVTRAGTVGAVSSETVEKWVKDVDCIPEEIVEVVVEKIISQINDKLRACVTALAASQQSADAQSQKKSLAAMQARAQTLYDSFCTFEAATSKFSIALEADLSSHVVRTVGGELAAAVLAYSTGQENAALLTEKQREETIGGLPSGMRDAVSQLYEAVKGGEFDGVHTAVEGVAARAGCAMPLRQPSDKAMSEWTLTYQSELRDSISSQSDAAAILVASVLLLLARADRPTTASGKFVARLIAELQDTVPANISELLVSCQKGVVNCIKNKGDDVAKEMLDSDINKLKEIVLA